MSMVISGIFLGGFYALIAFGLQIIYGQLDIINLAHGEFVVIAGYVTYFLYTLFGIDPHLSIIPNIFIGAGLGIGLYYLVKNVRQKILNTLILTFGLSILLQNAILIFFGDKRLSMSVDYLLESVNIGGASISYGQIDAMIIAIISISLVYIFLRKTDMGRSIRATSQNRVAAKLMGIDTAMSDKLAFMLGGSLAGVAGSIFTVIFYLHPYVGFDYTIKAFIIVVFAGTGTVAGLLFSGMIFGIIETVAATSLGMMWQNFFGLIIFFIIMLFRPQGLFGVKEE